MKIFVFVFFLLIGALVYRPSQVSAQLCGQYVYEEVLNCIQCFGNETSCCNGQYVSGSVKSCFGPSDACVAYTPGRLGCTGNTPNYDALGNYTNCGIPQSGGAASCYVIPPVGSTPPPAPVGTCNSGWCTTAAACSAIAGSSSSSGAGYCATGTDVQCCVPSSGGGGVYVSACTWDSSGAGSTCTGDGVWNPQGTCSGSGANCVYDSHCPAGQTCNGYRPCCPGLEGGSDGVCGCPTSPVQPVPSHTCSGGYLNISWAPTARTTTYNLKIDDLNTVAQPCAGGMDLCVNSINQNFYSISVEYNHPYRYQVQSVNSNSGQTTDSAWVNATCVQPVCGVPTPNLPVVNSCTATSTDDGTINFTWTPVAGADQYNVEVYDVNTPATPVITTGWINQVTYSCGVGTCTYVGTVPVGTYTFRVQARNSTPIGCTQSAFSSQSSQVALDVCRHVITSVIRDDPVLTGGQAPNLIGGQYCDSPSISPYSYTGTVNATDGISNWAGTIDGSGTYTISNVPGGGPYCIAFTPNDPNVTCTCPTGCTYCGKTLPAALSQNLKFFVSPVGNYWFQVIGGDVLSLQPSGNSVNNLISQYCTSTTGCQPYFITQSNPSEPDTTGALLVNRNSTVDLSENPGNQTRVNLAPPQPFAQTDTTQVCAQNYDYFARLYGVTVAGLVDDYSGSGIADEPTSAPQNAAIGDAYYYNGNLQIDNAWDIADGDMADGKVLFVTGDLVLNNYVTVRKGAFFAFIVQGNIRIANTVVQTNTDAFGMVQGVYIAKGSITVEGFGGSGTDLYVGGEGVFAACGNITVQRNIGALNNLQPAVRFYYRADFMTNAPPKFKTYRTNWREVAP